MTSLTHILYADTTATCYHASTVLQLVMQFFSPFVLTLTALILTLSLQGGDPPAQVEREAFYEKNIRPLLIDKCYACHSLEKNKTKGGLALDSQKAWLTGGEHGPALSPGKPDDSLLIKAVRYADDELRMPPKSHGGKLSDKEIKLLEQWVRDGAHSPKQVVRTVAGDKQWWSFKPITMPVPPDGKVHPIDAFLAVRHQALGIKPLGSADKRTLLRRLTFDLTGLPPTPEEVNSFLSDSSPQAFAKAVDRLLASPHYGERWGRHWLDVVRYADSLDDRSYDKEGDILDAWRYRDWVVNAFNCDLPYDQFIIQQIAGDILANQPGKYSADKIIATGMYAIGNWGNGDADKEKLHTDIVDDQVDVTSRAFLGLTVACARCHDHKFDPITTRDYYALSGFFFSSHILDKFQSKGEGEKLMRIALQSPDEKEQFNQKRKQLQQIEQQLANLLRPMKTYREKIAGKDELHGWGPQGSDNPSLVINTSDKLVSYSTIKLRPHTIAVHPGPQIPASIAWKSPLTGKLTIKIALHDADPNCGNGIDWELKHGDKSLHKGVMDNGKSLIMPETTVTMQKNDLLVLVIGPRGEYSCDTTEVEFTIAFEGGEKHDLKESLQKNYRRGASHPWYVCSGSGSKLVDEDQSVDQLEARQKEIKKQLGQVSYAQGMLEGGITGTMYAGFHNVKVHQRGSYHRLGDEVARGYPVVLTNQQPAITTGSGRLELARWIASPSHPLTARVMVNRLWQHHFGEGIVRTANNFGKLGTPPSHPELLDYMAGEFIRSGWSIKSMHRLIVTSQAYQRSSLWSDSAEHKMILQHDPDNLTLARQHRRRLTAEELRDSLLAATGELDKTLGGKAIRDLNSKRRTLYVTTIRSDRTTYQSLFDVADPTAIVEKRTEATVAPQSLWLLNHPFVQHRAGVLAEQLSQQAGDTSAKMHWLCQLLYARPALANELALAKRVVNDPKSKCDWEMLCQVALCANEFIYLD